jgi:hypothetical protein
MIVVEPAPADVDARSAQAARTAKEGA